MAHVPVNNIISSFVSHTAWIVWVMVWLSASPMFAQSESSLRSVIVTHHALITTNKGTIKVALYGKDAPRTVENFIRLSQKKFYHNIRFHRIAKDFVIQAGDPLTKNIKRKPDWGLGGESSWGGTFADELFSVAPSYQNGYRRGTMAMANRGPNTNTSQFFICLRAVPELPKTSTIFGIVIEGMETVQAIAHLPIESVLNDKDGRPLDPPIIRSIKIVKQ